MNQFASTNSEFVANPPPQAAGDRRPSVESSLDVVQINRKLQRIANSVESFLFNQVERLTEALEFCQQADERSASVQQQLDALAQQRVVWEAQKDAETERLNLACEKLIEGWKQLEVEKRNWLGQRARVPRQANHPASDFTQPLMPGDESVLQHFEPEKTPDEAAELHQLNQLRKEIQNHSRRR